MYTYERNPIEWFNSVKLKGYRRGGYVHGYRVGTYIRKGGTVYDKNDPSEFNTLTLLAIVLHVDCHRDVLAEIYVEVSKEEVERDGTAPLYRAMDAEFVKKMVKGTDFERSLNIIDGRAYFRGYTPSMYVSADRPNESLCKHCVAHNFLEEYGIAFVTAYKYRNNKGVESILDGKSISDAFNIIDDFISSMDGTSYGVIHRKNLENSCQDARAKIADLDKRINKDHEKKEELDRQLAEYGIQYIVANED